ncbi:hypothetical protein EYF80_050199 [Liparis tanakae]|uniref:Uncharacterized protein n=1 Tax=Liparis tanakae TaxID=230148 RepID=A0A4Z2FFC4_9TELE|nr:hypothetical protein EYF80_050199 [Liparis tanakae]
MFPKFKCQCWHWSPTQPGRHAQLPVAALHCPFTHGLSHSFASVTPGSAESSPAAESRSAVVSIRRLRTRPPQPEPEPEPQPEPEPEPEQARRGAPYISPQPKRWLLRGKRAPPPLPLPLLLRGGETATRRAAGAVRGSRFNGRPVRVLAPRCGSVCLRGGSSSLGTRFTSFQWFRFPAPHRAAY